MNQLGWTIVIYLIGGLLTIVVFGWIAKPEQRRTCLWPALMVTWPLAWAGVIYVSISNHRKGREK